MQWGLSTGEGHSGGTVLAHRLGWGPGSQARETWKRRACLRHPDPNAPGGPHCTPSAGILAGASVFLYEQAPASLLHPGNSGLATCSHTFRAHLPVVSEGNSSCLSLSCSRLCLRAPCPHEPAALKSWHIRLPVPWHPASVARSSF